MNLSDKIKYLMNLSDKLKYLLSLEKKKNSSSGVSQEIEVEVLDEGGLRIEIICDDDYYDTIKAK